MITASLVRLSAKKYVKVELAGSWSCVKEKPIADTGLVTGPRFVLQHDTTRRKYLCQEVEIGFHVSQHVQARVHLIFKPEQYAGT